MKRSLAIAVFVLLWSARAFANISMSGSPYDFGAVHLGTSAMVTKALTIPGPADESYTTIVLTGNSGTSSGDCTAQFTVAPASQTVPFTGGASVTITFSPTKRQANNCTGTFKNGGTNVGSFQFGGIGVAPAMSVSPLTADFGTVRVANATVLTVTRTVNVQNTGNADLQLTAVTVTGSDYALVSSPSLPATVAAGTSFAAQVVFDPSMPGTRTGTINFKGNDPGAGSLPDASGNLTGVGGAARIHVSNAGDTSATIDFGVVPNGTSTHANVRIANDAPSNKMALNVTTATISGGSWFSFGANSPYNCTAGSTSCSIAQAITATPFDLDVICNPSPATTTGTQTASIAIASDTDTGGVSMGTLSCTAGRSDVAASTTSLAFGNVRTNTDSMGQTFMIANTGNLAATYSISKAGANAADFVHPKISSSTC